MSTTSGSIVISLKKLVICEELTVPLQHYCKEENTGYFKLSWEILFVYKRFTNRENGELDNTIIAFSTDNGGVPYAGALNYPLK